MSNWLFLRGEWDERTQKSIDDNDDMWLQLFSYIPNVSDYADIYFNRSNYKVPQVEFLPFCYKKDLPPINFKYGFHGYREKYSHVFSRGGFGWQVDMLKQYPDAYKIRYGAGKRFMPEPDIDYQLILVDTEAQKQAVLQRYPKANVHLFIKPAALHFKPIECEKEYDVCFIANQQQARFKGVKWVYNTVPRDLKVLHLGCIDKHITPPPNITRKRVDRIDMPEWISKCKVGIVPYDNTDSCPRVIPEMMACGLPLICLETVNISRKIYNDGEGFLRLCTKGEFWKQALLSLKNQSDLKYQRFTNTFIGHNFYHYNLSLPVAVKHLKELING